MLDVPKHEVHMRCIITESHVIPVRNGMTKKHERKMQDQMTGLENAGPDVDLSLIHI